MVQLKKVILSLAILLFAVGITQAATTEQVRVVMSEYVDQVVIFNPLENSGSSGPWNDTFENQSYYNITGFITVTNENGADPISDIYISFGNTQNNTLPILYQGRDGTWRDNTPADGTLVLHIPEIRAGENSTWRYSVDDTEIIPPLNFTSGYSDYKVLAGGNITITDTIENVFDNYSYQAADTCIHNINITQNAQAVNFSGTLYDFEFASATTTGSDSSNVSYSTDNLTQYWDALNAGCLNLGDTADITYNVTSPYNIPTSQTYQMINSTLRYRLNQTISHMRLTDLTALSVGNISLDKQIVEPSDPILYGSNVTWNVSGHFTTDSTISYNLTEVTLWVSQRNVNGSFTDPNTVDNDTINTTSPLTITYTPNVIVNSSQSYTSPQWLFNYSDLPTPIAWVDINFSIDNDGVQLVNRSVTQNGNDYYIKELYLIIGYWLEIEKNISSVAADTYQVRIDVHNKGNQVTPAGSIVTIYDFVPGNFALNGSFVYSSSTWYSTAETNNSVTGGYNGTLYQWALTPTNSLNTSFAQGPSKNANTTWSATFNVTGSGDYTLLDVFITGLDPQKVDGAGSTRAVIVEEFIDKLKSTEGIFAVVATILLLLGFIV